jgi:hypothetical protein
MMTKQGLPILQTTNDLTTAHFLVSKVHELDAAAAVETDVPRTKRIESSEDPSEIKSIRRI